MEAPNVYQKFNNLTKQYNFSTTYNSFAGRTMVHCDDLQAFKQGLDAINLEIEQYRSYISTLRREKFQEAKDFLIKTIGLREFEYTGKSMKKTTAKIFTHLDQAISERYKAEFSGGLIDLNTTKKQIEAHEAYLNAKKQEDEKQKFNQNALSRCHALAAEYLTEAEVELLQKIGATVEQYRELIAERFMHQQLGLTHDCNCDECGTHTIGERRCSCGNRRISAYADFYDDGNKLNVYLTSEPY